MRKKFASLTYYKLAEEVHLEIIELKKNSEEKKGKIMVASQLYFYSGETGLKYLLNKGNYSIPRDEILLELKTYDENDISEMDIKKVEELYIDLLPLRAGGRGFRNLGAYQGKNSTIYESHREFAKFVVDLINKKNGN